MKKVYLDANVLLELFFRRARYDQVAEILGEMRDVQFCISVLSADIFMYFVENEKQSKDVAWKFIKSYQILAVTAQDADWAYDNDRGDFEDALQVACARRNGCSTFITLDQKLCNMYSSYIRVGTIG